MLNDLFIAPTTDVPVLLDPRDLGGSFPSPRTLLKMSDGNSGVSAIGGRHTTRSPARFSVINYPERLSEIVELRRLAYRAANKLGPNTEETIETEKADPRNRQATLVIAEKDLQIIGSVRLTPPLPGPLFHGTCQFDGPVQGLPPRSQFLESAWACIHPNHQGQGLFWHLIAHMVLTAKQLGKPYLVGGTAANLWPNWRRCGYRKTGTVYTGALSATELSVVVLKVEEVLAGRNIAPEFARVLLPLLATT